MNNSLPNNSYLNISALSRIFKSTSTSYKFLFFLSLLRKIKEIGKTDNALSEVAYIDIAVEMLLIAWFPHQYFRLSLGVQDQCTKILDNFVRERKIIFENGPITSTTVGQLRMELFEWLNERKDNIGSLLDYVPYRLLAPFYEKELVGIPQHKRNRIIRELTNTNNSENIPLYFFTDSSIQIDASWREYLQKNISIIEGWVNWHWCDYLQNRNPSVPAIPKKILPILQRSSMTKEIDYWKNILKYEGFKCIYSKVELGDFALDHFLPWTFVTHNQLWNLIPVTNSANSSKSNSLPSLRYFDDFIEMQFTAIQAAKKIYSEKKWKNIMQPYISDLHIASYSELSNQTIVSEAYQKTIMPLYEIASVNGFSSDWSYNDNTSDKISFIFDINDKDKYNTYLPFYSIEVAAGNFADSEIIEEPSSWLDISKTDYHGTLSKDLFVTQIKGHSMESTIPDGSYCLFKYGVVGSRNGRIVLAKKDGVLDKDFQTSFTIKRYFSEKIVSSEFEWHHEKIELRPDNPEYDVIEINEDDAENFVIVAEFIQLMEMQA